MQYLGAVSEMTEWSHFISKANHSAYGNPRLSPNHYEEAEVEWFYEDLQDFLKLKPKKDVFFIMGTGMQM